MQPKESQIIIGRFFEALDGIIESEKIGGVDPYCKYHKIDKRNLYKQRKDHNLGYFKVSWMVPLVRYYGINPRWLLTGKGRMMKIINDKHNTKDE